VFHVQKSLNGCKTGILWSSAHLCRDNYVQSVSEILSSTLVTGCKLAIFNFKHEIEANMAIPEMTRKRGSICSEHDLLSNTFLKYMYIYIYICPQTLVLISPTSGGRSVSIVRSGTQATEYTYVSIYVFVYFVTARLRGTE
jgi:hypothetical protein